MGVGWRSLAALVTALAILLGLGTWQLQRKQWKEALLAEIAVRAKQPPVTALGLPDTPHPEYVPVRLTGRFVPNTESHIFISVPRQPNGIGGPGYWVFQLFATGADVVYVNRGFVPEAQKTKGWDAPDRVVIEGILRHAEVRGRYSNSNDFRKNVHYVRDPKELSGGIVKPTRFRDYIDMTGPVPAAGLPLPLVGKINIPNRHLEYALTWYALAGTLLGVAFFWARAARR